MSDPQVQADQPNQERMMQAVANQAVVNQTVEQALARAEQLFDDRLDRALRGQRQTFDDRLDRALRGQRIQFQNTVDGLRTNIQRNRAAIQRITQITRSKLEHILFISTSTCSLMKS